MTNKRIAIIQNRIVKGGRFQVIAGLVKVLNQLGIVPDIITLKSRVSKEDAKQFYGNDLDFYLKEIFVDIRIPSDLHILFFNFLVRFYIKDYSLVINSSNSSFMLPGWKNVLSYVHFPRKARLLSPKLSIHFPDGENKNWFKPSHFFYNVAAALYRFNKTFSENEYVVANSEFTKDAFSSIYNVDQNKVKVIYPPVWKNEDAINITKNYRTVCGLGRFSKDKRQLEQISIAEKLPEYEFHLLGFANEEDPYFQQCKMLKKERNIKNVHLHPNVDFQTMNQILKEAGLFIHSMRNEPFGIVTVQAIANGSIPVVHNSGGQKEIVNVDELRYNDIDEAVKVFKKLESYSYEKMNSLRVGLIKNAQQYSYNEFEQRFGHILKEKLDTSNEY